MSVAGRLKELRLRKGASLQDVADAIGASKTHVWELEKNRTLNPSLEMLRKLSDYYAVPIKTLAGEDLESSDDEQLARMFRQASELTQRDREALDALIQSFRQRQSPDGTDH